MSLTNTSKFIDDAIQGLPPLSEVNEEERQGLLAKCKKLQAALETPIDTLTGITLAGHRHAVFRVAVEMGLFNVLAGVKEDGIDIEQLATSTSADQLLIVRIMRVLTATEFAQDLGNGKYAPTPKTGFFVDGSPLRDGIVHVALFSMVLVKLADYFREKGYHNPDDAYSGPFQYAFNTKLHYFDWLKQEPEQQAAFNSLMAVTRLHRGEEWFEFFPVMEKFQHTDRQRPLLIDIGGGLGHDISAFRARYPDLPGRLILQDLPVVIDQVTELGAEIDAMKYDFFTPQPVKGARAYYMRTVLHDWPDKQARAILENIREAMDPDSMLLLNENNLPESNVTLYSAEIDFSMMALFASLERTQKQWEELLESAGFEVVHVWKPQTQVAASAILFEAVPKK